MSESSSQTYATRLTSLATQMRSVLTQTDPTNDSETQTCEEFENLEDIVNNIRKQLEENCSDPSHYDTNNIVLDIFRTGVETNDYDEICDEKTLKSECVNEPNVNEKKNPNEIQSERKKLSIENDFTVSSLSDISSPLTVRSDVRGTHNGSSTSGCYYGIYVENIMVLQNHFENCLNFTCKVRLANDGTAGGQFHDSYNKNTDYLERVIFSIIHQAYRKSSALPETIFSTIGCFSPAASLFLSLGNTSKFTYRSLILFQCIQH